MELTGKEDAPIPTQVRLYLLFVFFFLLSLLSYLNFSIDITEPELVLPGVYNEGSNSSVKVSWTHPNGNVENYTLSLNSTLKSFNKTVQLSPTNTSFMFYNLSAGVLYSAVLTTCSGSFCVSSEFVFNATCE